MNYQNNIQAVLDKHQLIPVVSFNSLDEVEPCINLLLSKDIQCIEITLRTELAMASIERAIAVAPETFDVGAGTVVNAKQVDQLKAAGADFLVGPGSSPKLIQKMKDSGIPFLPGVMTPSEILQAMELDCYFLKLFPFNLAGGVDALKAYKNVFSQVRFCPTGGIGKDTYEEVLAFENVMAVGGSWLVK
jgi:2-dehydro-3-deoxyphosphogluconate aldolase/(4S)-4-hydroxy-2-oxoglutarate aldolase